MEVKGYSYVHGTKQDPCGGYFLSFWLKADKLLAVSDSSPEMLQNKDPPRSYSSRPPSQLVLGNWPKGGVPAGGSMSPLCLDLSELVSFFPSFSLCVWASNLSRAKMKDHFILFPCVKTNKR